MGTAGLLAAITIGLLAQSMFGESETPTATNFNPPVRNTLPSPEPAPDPQPPEPNVTPEPEPEPAEPSPGEDPIPEPPPPVARVWNAATGNFSVEAVLLSRDDASVTLRRADDGREVTVPLAQLSEADRKWVEENHPIN